MNLAKELSGKLWDMANTLRGTIDASEFKNYILVTVFPNLEEVKSKSSNMSLKDSSLLKPINDLLNESIPFAKSFSNFASSAGKKGGEFYTPASMSKLLTEIATVGLESVR